MSVALAEILAIAAGGAIGASARYGVSNLHWLDKNPYFYTILINVTGCLIMGVMWALSEHYTVNRVLSKFIVAGILGGYTTYSAFTIDAVLLWHNGHPSLALAYIATTLIGGVGCCAFGYFLTNRFF